MIDLNNLAAVRLRAGMGVLRISQRALAAKLSFPVAKVSGLMSGSRGWTLRDLGAVAEALGVQPETLFSTQMDGLATQPLDAHIIADVGASVDGGVA